VKLWQAVGAWELFWWARRRAMRAAMFKAGRERANKLGRKLVVVGAPDGGVTAGYECGDITIDLAPSSCPGSMQADVTQPLPFADDSVVVVVMCVLEYVDDVQAALRELRRVSGGNMFVVRVEPWTLTSFMYPGAKRTLSCEVDKCSLP
jgi:SAM-dependent methyltransferase